MGLLRPEAAGAAGAPARPVHLVLARDRVRALKQGSPWLYADSLRDLPPAKPGSLALVKDKDKGGEIVAIGMYDPSSPIAFRALASSAAKERRVDEELVSGRLERAVRLRERLFPSGGGTDGYRLVNGEGDGLPGLTVDVYAGTAVVKLDGAGPSGFYDARGVAAWLEARVVAPRRLDRVWLKHRAGSGGGGGGSGSGSGGGGGGNGGGSGGGSGSASLSARGELLRGLPIDPASPAVVFEESGVRFLADVVSGQKTGFFLDQRDNRLRMRAFAASGASGASGGAGGAAGAGAGGGGKGGGSAGGKGARVLNCYSYTGGFSVHCGAAGASHVTSVDIAAPCAAAADANWALNGLRPGGHEAVAADCAEFLASAASAKERWDVVVVDPPSFAPNKQSVDKAAAAYERVFALAASVTAPDGILALASCSSHIDFASFHKICDGALSRARRRAYVLGVHGQPPDHPFPAACRELQYLKFALHRLD